MAVEVFELLPAVEGKGPGRDGLKHRGLPRIVRAGEHHMPGQQELHVAEPLEAAEADAPDHAVASLRIFTTSSSLPRSSMTLTATWPWSPASKGALVVPARWSHTVSSYSPRRAGRGSSPAP